MFWPTLICKGRRDKKVTKVLVTNRTHWEIHRILKTYRYRWTGTETFHRAVTNEALRTTLEWAIDQVTDNSRKSQTRYGPIGVD